MIFSEELPPIGEDIFDQIKNKEAFQSLVMSEFKACAGRAKFKINFSRSRLQDAHQSFARDAERLKDSLPKGSNQPDHFKQAGTLAYWLRRFSPIIAFTAEDDDINCDKDVIELREFLRDYGEVFLAFDLGLQICRFFERHKEGANTNARDPSLDIKYAQMICYYLKYKNVSPHAITLIYASLFVG